MGAEPLLNSRHEQLLCHGFIRPAARTLADGRPTATLAVDETDT